MEWLIKRSLAKPCRVFSHPKIQNPGSRIRGVLRQSTVARGETGFWILDLAKYGKNLSVFGQSSS